MSSPEKHESFDESFEKILGLNPVFFFFVPDIDRFAVVDLRRSHESNQLVCLFSFSVLLGERYGNYSVPVANKDDPIWKRLEEAACEKVDQMRPEITSISKHKVTILDSIWRVLGIPQLLKLRNSLDQVHLRQDFDNVFGHLLRFEQESLEKEQEALRRKAIMGDSADFRTIWEKRRS